MKTLVIGIDHGNRFIKSTESTYSSGYIKTRKYPVGEGDVIKYKGKYYHIDGRSRYKYDKTIDFTYFILTLPALALRMEREGLKESDIILGIGLPLSHFSLKERYIKYFKREGVQFNYNRKPYLINIIEVMCFPQAVSGFIYSMNSYKNIEYLNIIDIGLMGINAIKTYNGRPELESAISLDYGIFKLIDNIRQSIIKEFEIEIDEVRIESILENENTSFVRNDMEKIIENSKIEFINNVLNDLNENVYDLQTTLSLLMGGGANMIQKILNLEGHKNRIENYELLPQPRLANALGHELLVNEALRRR